jgi:hypothetical protein
MVSLPFALHSIAEAGPVSIVIIQFQKRGAIAVIRRMHIFLGMEWGSSGRNGDQLRGLSDVLGQYRVLFADHFDRFGAEMDRSGRERYFVKHWEKGACENGPGRIRGKLVAFERKNVDKRETRVPGSGTEERDR